MSYQLARAIKAIHKPAIVYSSVGAMALFGTLAQAQEAGERVIEEVVVTASIRGSLRQSLDIKRNATGIVDAVSAEDVGKFPDSDVGEALGRVPGISIARQFGQGSSVSIRGASPQMTLTQLNGQNIASTGWFDQQNVDRSFNYSMLPSQLIAGMEVFKSSQADLNEGGIGGTVIVKTRKALELDANTAYLNLKAVKGSVSEDTEPELSGLYSWKNDDETFGILAAVSQEDRDYVRRGTESDYRWWGDVAPTTFTQERERTAINVNMQWAPTDNFSMDFDYMSMSLTGDNTNTSLYLFTQSPAGEDSWSCSQTNAAGLCTKSEIPEAVRGDLAPGWASGSLGTETFIQTWGRTAEMSSDSFDLSADFRGEGFTVTGSIGSTEADGGTDLTLNFQHFPSLGDPMSLWAGSIDATGKEIKINPTADPSMTLADYASTAAPQTWAVGKGPNTDEEVYAQIDVEFDLEWGAINSFKTGFRWTEHEVERSDYDGVIDGTAVPTSSLYSGTYEVGSNGFKTPEPDLSAMVSAVKRDNLSWTEARSGYSFLEEENIAAYGMFNFEVENIRGNFGLRYVSTDATRSQYALDGTAGTGVNNGFSNSLTKYDSDYSDVLPSVNIVADLSDNLVLRFSASQALSRVNYQDMVAVFAGYADDRVGNETVSLGSEGLLPLKSNQSDLSLEYYYGEGNMVSATYFIKSINNFIVTDIQTGQSIGIEDPAAGDVWTVQELKNSGGAEIEGIELQIVHGFDNGFGIAANYTYSNADAPAEAFADQIGIFSESSENTYNVVGYWENAQYSARAAYNYRSKYLIREGAFWYGDRWHDDYGTLDLSFGWAPTDKINVSLEITNLLEEDSVQYGAASADRSDVIKGPLLEGFPAWSFEGETKYQLGVSYKF